MKISVKLAAALREYAADANLNSGTNSAVIGDDGRGEIELQEGATPADVMAILAIPADQSLMVIVDGSMVARTEYDSFKLTEGQTLSLNPPIRAG